jgi:hypothetical protein
MSKRVPKSINGVSLALVGLTMGLAAAGPANAQQQEAPYVWEIPFGTPASEIPAGFTRPACGTHGGPPSTPLKSFEEFGKCRPEPGTGLREVWFSYDDDREYYLRAVHADPALIERFRANQLLDHLMVYSLLFDDQGRVEGYRLSTDPREPTESRGDADAVGDGVRAMLPYGSEDWNCTDRPPSNGETPYGGKYENRVCEKTTDGVHIMIETRRFLKAGQMAARGGAPQAGEFEAGTWIEAISADLADKAAPR